MPDNGGPKVMVATTGGDSETEKRLKITSKPEASRQVVMRLESGGGDGRALPDLRPGDLIRATVELELTTDCQRRSARRYCVESGYDFSPGLASRCSSPRTRTRRRAVTARRSGWPTSAR